MGTSSRLHDDVSREQNESELSLLFYSLLRTKSPITSFNSQQEHWANVSSVLRFKNNLYCLENAQIWIPDFGHSAQLQI